MQNNQIMKKTAFLFVVMSITLGSCYFDGWDRGISGNGNVVKEDRDVSGFTGVQLSSGIDVYLSEGNEFEVAV